MLSTGGKISRPLFMLLMGSGQHASSYTNCQSVPSRHIANTFCCIILQQNVLAMCLDGTD